MIYEHTQKSPMGWILFVIGLLIIIISSGISNQPKVIVISSGVAIILFFASFCFSRLTIRDETDFLIIQFGPLPVFRARILYSEITEVQEDRSNILDGWGIHLIPGRGLTYNVWGFDCVKILKGKTTIRIATDDKVALASFLKTKIQK